MTAYVVINVAEVKDASVYAQYRAVVSATIARAGGRYLVRGGEVDVLEGEWRPNRFVMVEFPNAEAARSWWRSEAYASLRDQRQLSTRTDMILVQGLGSNPLEEQ